MPALVALLTLMPAFAPPNVTMLKLLPGTTIEGALATWRANKPNATVKTAAGACSRDMSSGMNPCMQLCDGCCSYAASATVASFFGTGGSCCDREGRAASDAGYDLGATCSNDVPGTAYEGIVDALGDLTNIASGACQQSTCMGFKCGDWYVGNGAFSPDQLDTVLGKGQPVIAIIKGDISGVHAIVIGGCSGGESTLPPSPALAQLTLRTHIVDYCLGPRSDARSMLALQASTRSSTLFSSTIRIAVGPLSHLT